MRVLVLGQGGREHALAWRLKRSPSVSEVFCAPGNAGTAGVATNLPFADDDVIQIKKACVRHDIDLVVIGAEGPLVAGVADKIRDQGYAVFGPSAEGALLEGSKEFCKKVLRRAQAPTADYKVFTRLADLDVSLQDRPEGGVVKADGLCAGKGVIVCTNSHQVYAAAERMLGAKEFGRAGAKIVFEELLKGPEVSVLALTDGTTLAIMPPAHDYKRAGDGDTGPNTGGMGCVCPSPRIDADGLAKVEQNILMPTLHALRNMKVPFEGILYAGIMMTQNGPKILEYNVRFGDPECQALMLRLKSDLGLALLAVADGEGGLKDLQLEWDPRPSVCVVAASGGYPGKYKTGLPIRGLNDLPDDPDVAVFHAGTAFDDDRIVTSGGRVLSVCALGDTVEAARAKAYETLGKLKFTGMQFRTDIGAPPAPPAETTVRGVPIVPAAE